MPSAGIESARRKREKFCKYTDESEVNERKFVRKELRRRDRKGTERSESVK